MMEIRGTTHSIDPTINRKASEFKINNRQKKSQPLQPIVTKKVSEQTVNKSKSTDREKMQDLRVDARVNSNNQPTSVQLQKSQQVQQKIFKHLADSWKDNSRIRIRPTQLRITGAVLNKDLVEGEKLRAQDKEFRP